MRRSFDDPQRSARRRASRRPILRALDAARVAALGKKGSVTGLMKTLGALAPEQRKEFGARVNQLKGEIEAALEARKSDARRRGAGRQARQRADRRHACRRGRSRQLARARCIRSAR